jgi:hypothetical protein
MQQAWAQQVWVDYKTDQISADEVRQRWKEGPTDDFIADERQKLEDAKSLKPGLDQAAKDAAEAAKAAADKAAEAARAAHSACAEAERAREALETCMHVS